jgi:hypothetical protein
MKTLPRTAPSRADYRWATPEETKLLFKKLVHDQHINQSNYKQRFALGANTRRPVHLRFSPSTFHKENSLYLTRVFHEGLLRDQNGIYWIIKKLHPYPHRNLERREPRNSPKYERLAFLLAQGRANYAEIRLLERGDLHPAQAFPKDLKEYYLTRATTVENLDPSILTHQRYGESFAAILTANIFMRKWDQHLNNFAYAGDIPVAIDHDMIGPLTTFPHTAEGNSTFNLAFLSFKLLTTLSFLRPAQAVDAQAKTRLKHHFIRQNHREAWTIMQDLLTGLGLGAGLIAAEGLQVSQLRRSILAFKKIENIEALASRAGFDGQERKDIHQYLTLSQQSLGRDVGHLWHCLSGTDARLDSLDGPSPPPSRFV